MIALPIPHSCCVHMRVPITAAAVATAAAAAATIALHDCLTYPT